MTDWHRRFMDLSIHISEWSKDPSTKVGSVIVDTRRRVTGLGYNGFPRGVRDEAERYADKPTKYALVVHAEANAIMNCGIIPRYHTLYSSKAPCSECAKLIVQSGISTVVSPSWDPSGRWAVDSEFSRIILGEGEVEWIGLD